MADSDTREIERLIELVRCEPGIYDPLCKGHRDRDFINNFWKSVEQEMAQPHWTDQDCRKKWKNLRDTFRRKMQLAKGSRNGQAATKASKWVFYKSLTFLIPYLAKPVTHTSIPSDSLTETSPEENDEDDALSTASGDRFLWSTSSPSLSKRAKKKKGGSSWESRSTLPEHHRGARFFNEQFTNQTPCKKSDSQIFLESFAGRMDALPPHIQSVVRIQIAQVFHNAANVGSNPPIPLTPFQTAHSDCGLNPSSSQT